MTKRVYAIAVVLAVTCGLRLWAQAPQTMPANDLHKVRNMLREGYEAVKKDYYDAAFHGLDLDARFKEYDEKLKSLPSISAGFTAGDSLTLASSFSNNAITPSWDANSGVLTLTGIASLGDYQTALRAVSFFSSSANPTASGMDHVHESVRSRIASRLSDRRSDRGTLARGGPFGHTSGYRRRDVSSVGPRPGPRARPATRSADHGVLRQLDVAGAGQRRLDRLVREWSSEAERVPYHAGQERR